MLRLVFTLLWFVFMILCRLLCNGPPCNRHGYGSHRREQSLLARPRAWTLRSKSQTTRGRAPTPNHAKKCPPFPLSFPSFFFFKRKPPAPSIPKPRSACMQGPGDLCAALNCASLGRSVRAPLNLPTPTRTTHTNTQGGLRIDRKAPCRHVVQGGAAAAAATTTTTIRGRGRRRRRAATAAATASPGRHAATRRAGAAAAAAQLLSHDVDRGAGWDRGDARNTVADAYPREAPRYVGR